MKRNKIISALVVSVLALANSAAYEAKAKVTMEGSIVRETQEKEKDAKYEVFALDAIEDRSKNKVEIDVDSGIAGAHFELYYELKGTTKAEDGWAVNARNTHIWFKPVDQAKIRVGYVGQDDFFVERIDEEKVGNPFSQLFREKNRVPYYITNADVDEMGFSLAVDPIENLTVSAAIAPGIDNAGITKDGSEDMVYTSWGTTARYTMDAFKFEASFRDNGKDSWKVFRAGAGYETDSIYAFVQPIVGFEYNKSKDQYESNGVAIDPYVEYKIDALKLTAHLPVTFRLTGRNEDPNYLEFLAKAEYNTGSKGLLDDVTPYFLIKSMDETVVTLNDEAGDNFALTTEVGTAFKVGDAKLDLGVELDIHSKNGYSERVTWAIPFSAKIEF
ncbi:hypothetical protein [uncultured Treponema sp.]|uniref:hypothetical protein n=1 Tax=uncultured Treponema sp. TaxID=162155 RepID=UPI0025E80D82|nr:hypothetical protein [uncultured Treponema sp.]